MDVAISRLVKQVKAVPQGPAAPLQCCKLALLKSVRLCALASIDPVQRAEQKSECYAIMQGADI